MELHTKKQSWFEFPSSMQKQKKNCQKVFKSHTNVIIAGKCEECSGDGIITESSKLQCFWRTDHLEAKVEDGRLPLKKLQISKLVLLFDFFDKIRMLNWSSGSLVLFQN